MSSLTIQSDPETGYDERTLQVLPSIRRDGGWTSRRPPGQGDVRPNFSSHFTFTLLDEALDTRACAAKIANVSRYTVNDPILIVSLLYETPADLSTAPDEKGLREVIGTSFHNLAMPRIRYRTGDDVRVSEPSNVSRKLGDEFQISLHRLREVGKTSRGKQRWVVSRRQAGLKSPVKNS